MVSDAILSKPNPWQAFWRTLVKFDHSKVQPHIAFRNTIGVVLPLLVGIAMHSPLGGIAVASGAMNVSYSDKPDEPYDQRARRMLIATIVTALAVLAGGLISRNDFTAILVTAVWTFVAGMMVAVGTTEGDLGVTTVVMLVIYSAQSLSTERAVNAGLLALGGGLLETLLSLALWPERRYAPERRVLGRLYLELSNIASQPATADGAPPASTESTAAQDTLSALGQDRSAEGERYRSLLNQAERARLCLLTIGRLRRRMHREQENREQTEILDRFGEVAARILKAIGDSLLGSELPPEAQAWVAELGELTEKMRRSNRESASLFGAALTADALFQMDALAGQLRSVVDLVVGAAPVNGSVATGTAERLATLRSTNRLAILRANLHFKSTAFRHAIRLTACLVTGDILGRALDWRRSYWLPMTIVIVLKPDFTATFSRGVLRLAGTFAGLILATALFHFVHPGLYEQALLVGVCMFLMRYVGPANYGIFVSSLSGLIVLLVAMTGVSPNQVIAARGVNTFAGGTLALAAYWLWPTWERKQSGEVLAQMLDAYRAYFRAIADAYQRRETQPDTEMDSLRLAARLARSNVEASAARVTAEPGISARRLHLINAILASSHRLIRALMALDAGLSGSDRPPARDDFRTFANDVDLTFYYLSRALRRSENVKSHLPDLREDHRKLLESGDPLRERYALVNVETDRITNSLNTLSEQVLRWVKEKS